jgi:hypothetical protein
MMYFASVAMIFGGIFAIASAGRRQGLGGIEWLILFLGIPYIVLWFWQVFNARDLARKFNDQVQTTAKEPW